jgi:hypothetical protein
MDELEASSGPSQADRTDADVQSMNRIAIPGLLRVAEGRDRTEALVLTDD